MRKFNVIAILAFVGMGIGIIFVLDWSFTQYEIIENASCQELRNMTASQPVLNEVIMRCT